MLVIGINTLYNVISLRSYNHHYVKVYLTYDQSVCRIALNKDKNGDTH